MSSVHTEGANPCASSLKSDLQEETSSVPPELRSVNPTTLERYVRTRIHQTVGWVHQGLLARVQNLPSGNEALLECVKLLEEAANDILEQMPIIIDQEIALPSQQKYKLMFNHKCLALGCTELKCDLCEANPRRQCKTDYDKKYFKGDILKAKCGGSIYVELVDAESEKRMETRDMDICLEMCILDGNRYDQLFPDGVQHCEAKGLEACALLTGNEGRPLLQSHDRTANKGDGRVVVPLQNGFAPLPDLSVQYSSEALLSGRRPPFRLMVSVVSPGPLSPLLVVPAVSDGFVVASGRSRLAQKKHIPSVDDPVSRLENMGKERVKKLKDLRGTAVAMGMELPEGLKWKIIKVGDFRQLALEADKDGQLRQKMLHILKMSEKAWDETRDHALMAVTNDTRMRAWYRAGSKVGLLYTCYLGQTDMDRPVALIEDEEVILKEHLSPAQRELIRDLQKEATASWWEPGHTGWTFYHYDSELYKQTHQLPSPRQLALSMASGSIETEANPLSPYDHYQALPGKPIMAGGVIQAVPMSSPVPMTPEPQHSHPMEDDDIKEGRKRMRVDRGSAQASMSIPRMLNYTSPFERPEQQRFFMPVTEGTSAPTPILPPQPPDAGFGNPDTAKPEPVKRHMEMMKKRPMGGPPMSTGQLFKYVMPSNPSAPIPAAVQDRIGAGYTMVTPIPDKYDRPLKQQHPDMGFEPREDLLEKYKNMAQVHGPDGKGGRPRHVAMRGAVPREHLEQEDVRVPYRSDARAGGFLQGHLRPTDEFAQSYTGSTHVPPRQANGSFNVSSSTIRSLSPEAKAAWSADRRIQRMSDSHTEFQSVAGSLPGGNIRPSAHVRENRSVTGAPGKVPMNRPPSRNHSQQEQGGGGQESQPQRDEGQTTGGENNNTSSGKGGVETNVTTALSPAPQGSEEQQPMDQDQAGNETAVVVSDVQMAEEGQVVAQPPAGELTELAMTSSGWPSGTFLLAGNHSQLSQLPNMFQCGVVVVVPNGNFPSSVANNECPEEVGQEGGERREG